MNMEYPYTRFLNLTISKQISLLVIAIGVSTVLLATAVLSFLSYQSNLNTLESSLDRVEESYVPALSSSVYSLDSDKINLILLGILEFPDIIYVEIIQHDLQHIAPIQQGDAEAHRAIERSYPLSYPGTHIQSYDTFGTLLVVASLDGIWDRLFATMYGGLMVTILAVLLATLLIYIGVYKMVARPIQTISSYSKKITIKGRTQPLTLPGKRLSNTSDNELIHLATTINQVNQRLRDDFLVREKLEHELENHRDHLQDLVQKRTHELEAINKELESFSYSVSHDLKAPLRTISGFCQALTDEYKDKLSGDGQHYLSRVQSASYKMSGLIDDLLALSRVTRSALNPEMVNLSKLSSEIAQGFQDAEPSRQITIEIEPDLNIECDKALINIALTNLIDNAFKYTRKSSSPLIQFGQTRIDDKTYFFIRDNGAGFDMNYAGKLFTPFQRLHDEREYPGNGVGLATVQRIIHRLGGDIFVEAEPDKGACFFFSIAMDMPTNAT